MPLSFSIPPVAFGLSLSDHAVKIAQLRHRRHDISVDFVATSALPAGLIEGGELKDHAKTTAAIAKALEPFRKTLAPGVVAAVPEAKTFIQTISVPKKEGASFDTQLISTLPQCLPVPIDDVYYDAAIVSETPAAWTTLVGAVARPIVDSYIKLLEALDFVPFALESKAAAIARAVIPVIEQRRTVGVINLSREHGYLVVHDNNAIQFTLSLSISGDDITKRIASALDLSPEQAEKAKITCGLDPRRCEGVLKTILRDNLISLVTQLKQAREFYLDHFPDARDFDEILLCGGGAHLYSLDQMLAEELALPVRLADIWQNVKISAKPTLDVPLRYATAVGLALRGLNVEHSL